MWFSKKEKKYKRLIQKLNIQKAILKLTSKENVVSYAEVNGDYEELFNSVFVAYDIKELAKDYIYDLITRNAKHILIDEQGIYHANQDLKTVEIVNITEKVIDVHYDVEIK